VSRGRYLYAGQPNWDSLTSPPRRWRLPGPARSSRVCKFGTIYLGFGVQPGER